MRALISRSRIKGRVSAPSSKSYTLRGLMCAALARGKSEVIHPLASDDTEASLRVLGAIGVGIHQKQDLWRISGGNLHQAGADLSCGESAATLRFMTAICSATPGEFRLVAGPSLSRRPIEPLIQALRQLGATCSSQDGAAAVVIAGGKLRGGVAELPGDISSQFVSALLLAAPLMEEGITVKLTTPLESKPYVQMTLDTLRKFGVKAQCSRDWREFAVSPQTYRPVKYEVEGDWSSASYLLALGALSGEVQVENLNLESCQGDKVILDLLKDMGATVMLHKNSVTVRKSKLNAIRVNLSDCIDLLPTVAVLAAVANGVSEFSGISRARIKESDRVAAVKEGLNRMGIKVIEEKNRLVVAGASPKGSVIDSRDDHRIAMAFSILGVAVGDMVIENAECVAKTYPQFWEVLKSLAGEVKTDG
ncbi:3-phosphoshikimate 1-carboxyvinyltransferase [Chloroflexota bacterium]